MHIPKLDSFDAALIDIGNVLLAFDYAPVVKLVAGPDAGHEAMSQVLALRDKFETGGISTPEFIAHVRDVTGFSGSDEEFKSTWQSIFTPIPSIHEICHFLKRNGKKLVLFSNINPLHVEDFDSYPIFSIFDESVFSFEARGMKPHPPMYLDAINRVGLNPARTIYLDDVPENLSAGQSYGFHTIPVTPNDWHSLATSLLEHWS